MINQTSYTALDFVQFKAAGALNITPKFQRRPVWKTPARSYLIETVLLGLPVPPIFLRVQQSPDKSKTIREVVDGQQRISAVLGFLAGDYKLSKVVGEQYRGRFFEDLDVEYQNALRTYSFRCEILDGISDADVLKIFARVNVNAIKLNAQELRNGNYFGFFKQTCYALALEHIEYWRLNGIASETNIARMLEVELTSELLIASMAGMQDKKKSIDQFYKDYDEDFLEQARLIRRFRQTIDIITEAESNLSATEFSRRPLFYSLFAAVYHRRFGLPSARNKSPRTSIPLNEIKKLRKTIADLSAVVNLRRRGEILPEKHAKFVEACIRQTDNIEPRRTRFSEIYRLSFG